MTPPSRACDDEPIRVPGAVQPHGALVALAAGTLEVLQVSANAAEFFGVTPDEALGRPLAALLADGAPGLLAALRGRHLSGSEPLFAEALSGALDVRAHAHQGVVIVEFERNDHTAAASDTMFRAALARLQRPDSVSGLCAVAVEEVRRLTGFDRVLLYRFDEEGHGDVAAEARADDVDAYLGLRFPASDIPRQARELYVLNWLRLIPDAAYVPVPLVPARRPDTGGALDLSFAALRSVSPVHLEYLKNMGVGASMSVSLVRDGRLWGLIACHHRSARHVSFAARAACEVLGGLVSLQIAALDEVEARRIREALRGVAAPLVDAMRDAPADAAMALLQRGDALLQLVGAGGAAVSTGAGVRTVGATPDPAQVAALVAWMAKEGAGGVLHTDALSALHPAAAAYADVASGLLALTLPGVSPSHVLWFRPEVVRTVTWAGDPSKRPSDGGTLHPRYSFEAWKDVRRGRSRPWLPAEVEAAEDLRRRAIEADLGKQIARAEQAVRLRDDVVAVVSHDLKNPLQVIGMATSVLRGRVGGDVRAGELVATTERAVARMSGLIEDLLNLAKIEAGRFELAPMPCEAHRLVSEAFAILSPIAEAKGVHLGWCGDGDAWIYADPERVFQVLSNLVGNAIKFTPAGGSVTVALDADATALRFAVRDTGPGIPAIELGHVFDRYWQARRGRGAGAGLGLYIAKGIVVAHGGRIWTESTVGAGATFSFTLPTHVPPAA